jgi:hypothetical protein
MKKSCQLYKLLFCKGEDVMHCTINVAMMSDCTKVEHRFGARRLAQLTGRYLAQIMMKKQSSVNGCVR